MSLSARLLIGMALLVGGGEGMAEEWAEIAALRRLPTVEAEKALPVRVKGVVTWHSDGSRMGFIVDDGREGIFCDLRAALEQGDAPEVEALRVGMQVELEGVTGRGFYAPVILPKVVKVMGIAELPAPKQTGFPGVFSGLLDAQRVSLNGVVRRASVDGSGGRGLLDVRTVYGAFQVVIPAPADGAVMALEDAEVRVVGCVIPLLNARRELVGVSIQTNLAEDLKVVTPAPADPFAVAEVGLRDLRPFSPAGAPLHRVRVRGVVTAQRMGRVVFLEEAGRGVSVFSPTQQAFAPGDVVEAVGFVNYRSAIGSLENALLRKVGENEAPTADRVEVAELMRAQDPEQRESGDRDGSLVEIEGQVVSVEWRAQGLRMTLECEGNFVPVEMDVARAVQIKREVKPGAEVRATGVVSLVFQEMVPMGETLQPQDLLLILRSEADLEVVASAPWWTPERAGLVVSMVGLVAAMLLAWVWALNRRVARQSNELFLQKREMRDREIEREITQRERTRVGSELHDGLQQLIAALSFNVQTARGVIEEDPDRAESSLDKACHMAELTQEELRRCLWSLREVAADKPMALEEALREAAAVLRGWGGVDLTVEAHGQLPLLPRHATAGLCLLTQEAIGNALKHGRPERVTVSAEWTAEGLRLTIEDDGIGFDPQAVDPRGLHFGLKGMAARIRRLGGHCHVDSSPGSGTRVKVLLSQEALAEEAAAVGMEMDFTLHTSRSLFPENPTFVTNHV